VGFLNTHFQWRVRLGVAVDQKNFMLSWCEGLQQEHPEVRHEIARDTVVWIVEKNLHGSPVRNRSKGVPRCMGRQPPEFAPGLLLYV